MRKMLQGLYKTSPFQTPHRYNQSVSEEGEITRDVQEMPHLDVSLVLGLQLLLLLGFGFRGWSGSGMVGLLSCGSVNNGTSGRVGWGCHQHHSGRAGGWGRSALTPLQGTKGLSLSLFLLGVLKWKSALKQKPQDFSHQPAQFQTALHCTEQGSAALRQNFNGEKQNKSYEMLNNMFLLGSV